MALERTEESLRIHYRVANRSDLRAYLSVRTGRDEGSRRPYTLLQPPEPTLLLTFAPTPLPPRTEIYAPIMPLFTPVEGGVVYEDFAEVELPVHEEHPYGELLYPSDPPRVAVTRLLFACEAVFEPDLRALARWGAVEPLVKVVGYPEHVLSAALEPEEAVPVLQRTDPFHRFTLTDLGG